MNLPDWLSLSATSGTGSGKITATADSCTARAARRTTAFSVKTTSGSSRMVKVIQNGIAEFVNISTQDINLPAVLGGQTGSIAIAGTSNSAILTVLVGGTLQLTSSAYTVTDKDGNSIAFVSGSPIEGDPGAEAQYSFSLVFNYIDNPTNEVLSSSVTVMAQSGDSASINVSQAAGSHADITVPIFTINEARSIGAAATSEITPAIVVYDPNEVGWDILAVPSAGITFAEESTTNFLTPISVNVEQNVDTENGRSFVLYLVPEGAVNTSVVYSSIVINQAAAPVNPYIEGDVTATTYAGGEIAFRVVDQKGVGWYPNVHTWTGNEGSVLITGVTDKGRPYEDVLATTVFDPETGNERIVGDGIVKVHMNAADEEGNSVIFDLCVSLLDTITAPYDTVTISVSDKPQFAVEEYEIVLQPNEAVSDKTLTALTVTNPKGLPFVIVTSNNTQQFRKATIEAGSVMVYDETEPVAHTPISAELTTLAIEASGLGQFNIKLKSEDMLTDFGYVTVKVYRKPVIKFDNAWTYDNKKTLHVTEPYVNTAKVYEHYAEFNPDMYSDNDLLSNAALTYGCLNDMDYDLVTIEGNKVTAMACTGASDSVVVIRAYVEASGWYKEAEAIYVLDIVRTQMYVYFSNPEIENDYENLRHKITMTCPGAPVTLNYTLKIDDYSTGEIVRRDYKERYPDRNESLLFTSSSIDSFHIENGSTIVATRQYQGTGEFVNFTLDGANNYYDIYGTEFFQTSVIFVDVVGNADYQFTVTYNGLPLDYIDGHYYLYHEESPSGGAPKNIVLSLTSTVNGNSVPVNHVLQFSFNGTTYNNDFSNSYISATSYGTAMSTSASTHTVRMAMTGNPTDDEMTHVVKVSAYEDTTYENELGMFEFYMHMIAVEAYWFELVNEQDLQWYENIGNNRIVCQAGSKTFPFALRSNHAKYEVDDKPIEVAYRWYTIDPVTGNKTQLVGGDIGFQWMMMNNHSLSGETEPDDTPEGMVWFPISYADYEQTGEDGVVNSVNLTWTKNSDDDDNRGCDIRLRYKVDGTVKGEYIFSFVQLKNEATFVVRLYKKTGQSTGEYIELGSLRELETDFVDSVNSAWYARCFVVDSNGDTEKVIGDAGFSLSYGTTNYENLTVDANGLLTLQNTTTSFTDEVRVVAQYSTFPIIETVLYYVSVAASKKNTEINILSFPDATYLDEEYKTISAYSTSGAEVTISPITTTTSKAGRVSTDTSYIYTTEIENETVNVTALPYVVATASSSLPDIAGDVTFRFSCEETETHKRCEITRTLTIAKRNDTVTDWDVDNVGFTLKNNGNTQSYRFSTLSGRNPSSLRAVSQYSANATLTYPYNSDSKRYAITPKNAGTYQIEAVLGSDANFEGGTITSSTFTISALPVVTRTATFSKSSYTVDINSQVKVLYTITPYPQYGTKSISKVVGYTGGVDIVSVGQSEAYIKGTKKGRKDIKLTVTKYTTGENEYSTCTATTTINVNGYPNYITFSPSNPTIETAGGTVTVTVTATSGTPTVLVPSGIPLVIESQSTTANSRTVVLRGDTAGTFNNALRAYATGTGDYNDTGSSYCKVIVGQAPKQTCSVTFQNSYDINAGGSLTITGTVLRPDTGYTMTFVSSDGRAVITSSSNASVTITGAANNPGTATITVTMSANNYDDYVTRFTVNVQGSSTITSRAILIGYTGPYELVIPSASTGLKSFNLNATTSPSGEHINYRSELEGVATVSSSGTVTSVGKGTTTITMWLDERSGYSNPVEQRTVTVIEGDSGSGGGTTPQSDGITFDRGTNNALVYYSNDYVNCARANSQRIPIRYASSNVSAAKVIGAYAKAEAGSAGQSIDITLKTSVSASSIYTCTINITNNDLDSKNLRTIDWTTNTQQITVKQGDTFYIYAALINNVVANNVWVTWESEDVDYLTVNGGIVRGVAMNESTAQITASIPEGTDKNNIPRLSAAMSYEITSMAEIPQLTFAHTDDIYYFNIGATLDSDFNVAHSDSPGYIQYSSSNSGIARFSDGNNPSSTGLIVFGGDEGMAEITASQAAYGKYAAATKSYRIDVRLYRVEFMSSLSSNTPITAATLGTGYATSYTAYITYKRGSNQEEYEGDYQQISGWQVTSSERGYNSYRHVVSFAIPANTNTNGRAVTRTIEIVSDKNATARLVLTQPTSPQYEIVYKTSAANEMYSSFANEWNLTNDMGGGDAAGGTDEQLGQGIGGAKLEYIKLYSYSVLQKNTSVSYYTTASWLKVYIGDGNTSGATAPTYGSPSTFNTSSSTGIANPHVLWEANNSSSERTAMAVFTYGTQTLTLEVTQKGAGS